MLGFALRAAIMYFLAMIMIRLLGKRALGELGALDFVVMTGVGHTVVSVALDKSIPFYEGIIILATLAVLEYTMNYLSLKSQKISQLLTGKPIVLIEDGIVVRENLAREKFNVDDLLQELRKKGVADLDQVHKGILEACGGFSVVLKEIDQPLSRRDLNIKDFPPVRVPTTEEQDRSKFLNLPKSELDDNDNDDGEAGFDMPGMIADLQVQMQLLNSKLSHLDEIIRNKMV